MNPAPMPSPEPPLAVEEFQGLYGPFAFSERLLQRIWAHRAFDGKAAASADGRRVEILEPGRWNRLGGPDFRDARLRLGDREIVGDVELHLRAKDWVAHGHALDPAYDNVVLHVVLLPTQERTLGSAGREIPVLALLPLLPYDLEEFAADEAVEALAARPADLAPASLAALPAIARDETLIRQARRRWEGKVEHARRRVALLGWEGACHHAALEILGHRYNRAPMLAVAGRFPLGDWSRGSAVAEAAAASQVGRWKLSGVRPANHPRARLLQYAAWNLARPGWPDLLRLQAAGLPVGWGEPGGSVAQWRRQRRLTAVRRDLAGAVCDGKIGGTRFDTLVCDGFLPLLSAVGGGDFGGCWSAWFPGDLPPALPAALRALGVFGGVDRPASHGFAQGLLGWLLDRGTSRDSIGPCGT